MIRHWLWLKLDLQIRIRKRVSAEENCLHQLLFNTCHLKKPKRANTALKFEKSCPNHSFYLSFFFFFASLQVTSALIFKPSVLNPSPVRSTCPDWLRTLPDSKNFAARRQKKQQHILSINQSPLWCLIQCLAVQQTFPKANNLTGGSDCNSAGAAPCRCGAELCQPAASVQNTRALERQI